MRIFVGKYHSANNDKEVKFTKIEEIFYVADHIIEENDQYIRMIYLGEGYVIYFNCDQRSRYSIDYVILKDDIPVYSSYKKIFTRINEKNTDVPDKVLELINRATGRTKEPYIE